MIEAVFWGGGLRRTRGAFKLTPFILVGLFVAGIFRRLLGHEGTRRLFGGGTRRELPQAWLIGMLLPVCSLGRDPDRPRNAAGADLRRHDPGVRHDRPAIQPAVDALRPDPVGAVRHPVVRVLHDGRRDGRGRRSGTGSSPAPRMRSRSRRPSPTG